MRVNGETLYELIDTPGFQRARKALEWMRGAASTAADRPAAVRRFVEEHAADPRFASECELLAPIVRGAGIIYVVDGAVPYGPEYEVEMDILRWTGRPSLAVINAIGEPRYVEEWRAALSQYFRISREVDVMSAPLEQRLELLRAFGELDPSWRPALGRAVDALNQERAAARARAARIVAELLVDALVAAPEMKLRSGEDAATARTVLEERYREQLRVVERHARDRVEQTYHHAALTRDETLLEVVEADLFEQQTWELFGLSRTAMAGLGIAGGAAAGLGIDAAVGGASLLMGSVIGAVSGGAAAWFASDRLADVEQRDLPFGEQVLRIRAGANRNLPFVLLGRARLHHAVVAQRSHAHRDALVVEEGAGSMNPLTSTQKSELGKLFQRIARGGVDAGEEQVGRLSKTVEELLD